MRRRGERWPGGARGGAGEEQVGTRYAAYADEIRARLRQLGIRGAAVDDLVQDVLCVAFRNEVDVPEEASARWLMEVARKLAANYRRLLRHTFEVVDTEVVMGAVDERTEDVELRELVRDAVQQLGAEDRDVLVRHEVGGETLVEIGMALGYGKSNVHARLMKSRGKVFRELRGCPREPG